MARVWHSDCEPGAAALKRYTWDIFWLSPDGEDESYSRIFFLHENSFYWEQYQWKNLDFRRPVEGAAATAAGE